MNGATGTIVPLEAARTEQPQRAVRSLLTLTVVAAAVAVVAFGYRFATHPRFANDHFVHLSMGQQITLGALPVRDFVERGIPLMSAVSALGQVTFGPGLHAERLVVALGFAAAAAFTVVGAALVSGSIVAGTAVAAITVLAYPTGYAYPKLLVYAAAFVAAWAYAKRPTAVRLVGLSITVAAAFLFRHDHGVILAVAVAALLLTRHGLSRALVRAALLAAVIGVVLLSPFLLWVQAHEGLVTYFADGMAFSRREAERSWRERPVFALDRTQPLLVRIGEGPIVNVRWADGVTAADMAAAEQRHGLTRLDPVSPTSWQYELSAWSRSAVERLVRDPAVADTHGINRSTFVLEVPAPRGVAALITGWYAPGQGLRPRQNGVAALFYAAWLLPAIAALLLATAWQRTSVTVRAVVAMAIVVQLMMNVTMLRDPLDVRIRDVVAPLALLLAFACGSMWRLPARPAARLGARAVAVLLMLLTGSAAAGAGPLAEHLEEMRVMQGRAGLQAQLADLRAEFAPPAHRTGRVSPEIERLVAYLETCTPPDARLFTMTFAPELFFYAHRGFAGGHVSLTPGYYVTERHAALMLERLRREDVPVVIMDSETRDEMTEQYPRVLEYVGRHYEEFANVTVGAGKDLILLGASGRAVGQFGESRWPCYAAGGRSGQPESVR